jgi:hypothetical protein
MEIMSELLEKKIVQIILGAIVILIWGYNMLKITDIATPVSPDNEIAFHPLDQDLLELPDLLQYNYKADFRDPFTPGLTQQASLPVVTNIESEPPPPVTPPDVKLTGVIEGTALLQNNREELFFAAPGDTVDGALVKSVTPSSVVMIFKTKEFTVTLIN